MVMDRAAGERDRDRLEAAASRNCAPVRAFRRNVVTCHSTRAWFSIHSHD
jgi:hypothetical protein